MTEYARQGMTKVQYVKIHMWLRRNFKKPDKCEKCKKPSEHLENALIFGKRYEMVKENFMVLCIKCHRKYDKANYSKGIDGTALAMERNEKRYRSA